MEKTMKFILLFLMITFVGHSAFAYEIQPGNNTGIEDQVIKTLSGKALIAIKRQDREGLESLFYPERLSLSAEQGNDFDLFLDYLLARPLEFGIKWKATAFDNYEGYIFKSNRYPVNPTINIDLFKKYTDPKDDDSFWTLSFWAVQDDAGDLKLVYYMNDYLVKPK